MSFRITFLRLFSFLLATLFFCNYASSQSPVDLIAANDLDKTLKKATSSSDSLKVLLDIYTLSDKINRDKVRVEIINLVRRSSDSTVIKDVLTELATSTDDAGDLAQLIEISNQLSDSEGKRNIETMLQMERAQADANTVGDSDVAKQMTDYVRGFGITGDPYEEIQNIYRAMVYLGASSQGPLYFEYIKHLEDLVEKLPERDHAIKNLFYTTAAIYYTRKRDYNKAIELDQKLLKELDAIKAYNARTGSKQDLDYYYFVVYRRLLRNFKGLTPEEVENYYAKSLQLAEENEKVAQDIQNLGLTKAYYYMAKEDYPRAIPELKKALASDNISKYRRRELLGHLGLALRETGNSKEELETLREFSRLLLDDREERTQDMYREIEMRNSVNKILADEYKQQQAQRAQNAVMRKTSLTIVYVLALALIFLLAAYVRLKNKTRELEAKNKKLRTNIEHIFDDGVPKGANDLRHHKHRLKG